MRKIIWSLVLVLVFFFNVGFIYTSAVFLAYFLIGIGALRFVQALVAFPWISLILFSFTAACALVLGVFSIYDYLKARKGQLKEKKYNYLLF